MKSRWLEGQGKDFPHRQVWSWVWMVAAVDGEFYFQVWVIVLLGDLRLGLPKGRRTWSGSPGSCRSPSGIRPHARECPALDCPVLLVRSTRHVTHRVVLKVKWGNICKALLVNSEMLWSALYYKHQALHHRLLGLSLDVCTKLWSR